MLYGSKRSGVAVEYGVRCVQCQHEIAAGEPHDTQDVAEHGATVVWHTHANGRCVRREASALPPPEPGGVTGGEAVAAAVGTLVLAGLSYALGRYNRAREPR